MIRFLIKLSLFLFFVFVVISFFVAKPSNNYFPSTREEHTTTSNVIIAFKEALNDLGTFCDRNIQACKVGKSFLHSLGERAYYGATAAYEYLGHILDDKNMKASQSSAPNLGVKEPTQKHGSTTLP
ncbi:DUF5330 domain-containing protein [Bartonella doshiae]|uniref:Uncharacterized protein n=2 Tax=Bartonella doshiae TaxID=33044 RepID=A0A380ZE43_BARDO|nr:DUF5330 domain-containing protein [Bartonella doshiae]EJF81982.1 hypothetical protein MCS_00407 [Bartonella doshiae NCTC 12862 = ATCC 700133]MBB6158977.1 hypothetical protein [Bartonella doshiae]SUV44592.1 Uncharacterised protein [Bartonella doshiae]